ncbi:hypothetical protein [Avibacterium paragallinarum]|uniref:hypothetical protein n=1 Tax=Avibacterium paragallinarum TaxID=728 RepID=UPI000349DF1F|nr:hypothetical protein [Avibacterium paragallinarum]
MTEIIEQIKQIIESGEIAQAALAREVDLSGGALSSFLNGKYKGDNQKIRQVLENWLEQREIKRSQFISAPDFIETPTAKLIHTIISYAHALGCITTVFGMSGAGKTVAAREYQKRHRNVWLGTDNTWCIWLLITAASPQKSTAIMTFIPVINQLTHRRKQ